MTRRLLAIGAILAVSLTCIAWAQDPAPSKSDAKPAVGAREKDDATVAQDILARQFREFEQVLLRVAQRMERSSKPEDRERAINLKKAIELAGKSSIDTRFDKLISVLKTSNALSIQEIQDALEQSSILVEDIQAILELLLTDSRDEQIRREKKRLMDLLKQLDKVIREQKVVRAQTESGRTEKDRLAKSQGKLTKDTAEISKSMSKDGKDSDKADGKKGEGKPSEGEGKGGEKGKPKEGAGQGSGGQPQNPGEKKEGQKSPPGDQDQKPQDSMPGRKQVQDANQYQRQAEDKIKKDEKDEASSKQDKAIAKLEEARKKLEEILKQLREEEIERLLAALQARCELMLRMQIEVHEGTVRVEKSIFGRPDKKADRGDEQKSLALADREEAIVREANKAIQILESEGSAVAFPEVFVQIRDDMKHVARRLGKVDVGDVTQIIEKDIITTLKEMIEALKKARADNKGGGGGGGGPGSQKLIDLLAELKMIRAMQARVNVRTEVYGTKYTGEQADDPEIQKELVNLAQRQLKIHEVTDNIYRGKNR